MALSKRRFVRCSITVLFFLNLFASVIAQQVVLKINPIGEDDNNYLIKGTVVMSNLNPVGQIVEEDGCSIIADIKSGLDSQYPVLPDALKIRTPANVETSYLKNKHYLTKNEYYGIDTIRLVIAGMSPRGRNIWRNHGGLNHWRRNAPNCVTMDFEGVIPKRYAGKTVRIRASLRHQWGGPFAAWSAYSFHHDIGFEGVLGSGTVKKPESHKIYIGNGPAGDPNPVATGGLVQCKISGKDTKGHQVLYEWSIKPQAGSFNDNTIPDPIWTAPENTMDQMRSYTISCTITCSSDSSLKETGTFVQDVCPKIKPVSIILRISSDGFETVEKKTKTFIPTYQKLVMTGSVMPGYRNSDEAGILGKDSKVFAELIVLSEGKEVRAKRMWIKMYSDYWLTVDLNEFAGCTKKKKAVRRRNIRLKPVSGNTDDENKKKDISSKEIYEKILSGKYEKKGFKKIWQIMGIYKAYENDKVHVSSGGKGTPALDKFFKNLKQGPVGEMKNAVNTLWEFSKDPLTLGGSAVEDLIQNTNKTWKRIFGKGFLKNQKKGSNSLKDAGTALKNKLDQLQKAMEMK